MANSPSHKLGQLIGNLLEVMFIPILQDVANRNNLYLDVVGQSREFRPGKKINWMDSYGSSHDLDYVLEYGGSESTKGRPVAFIESAWRRYTKHSKNKAQEIQGAVLPIADKYSIECPFLGAILAGEFTAPSLNQLRGCGFTLIYLNYHDLVLAFADVGIDISFEENTPTLDLSQKVYALENISQEKLNYVTSQLFKKYNSNIQGFIIALESKIKKQIKNISVTPLYGNVRNFSTLNEAKEFISSYDVRQESSHLDFGTFMVSVEYFNRDNIKAEFSSKEKVLNFLDYVLSTH